ncbi:hypothetical protein Ob7_05581 [Thermosipho africanus Ob7]|uniref:hypothetical protein n=1 Tax=Thermosipho africanus TaxID=2421 RepID=UPI000E0A72EB|nr:hypothetical protein [Thermosipho africanus]RDI91385.1 hypothetical protein Ob7_05581 [Thermosipho africanus Ob7]
MKKIVIFFFLFPLTIFSNILGFWVDPFNALYGFSISQNIEFWNIKALLRYDLPVNWEQGFPLLRPEQLDINFELYSETYSVEYGYFHKKIPFYVSVNPYEKNLNIVWGFTGFYGNYSYFNSDIFDFIFNEDMYGFALKYNDYRFFFENSTENILGLEYNGIVVYFDRFGLEFALNINNENMGFYFVPVNGNFGFVLKDNENFLFLNDDEVNFNWKWGEIYVVGGFQKEKRQFSIEFSIW